MGETISKQSYIGCLSISSVLETLDEYDIRYTSMSASGDVDCRKKILRINPVHRKDALITMHEFAHIHCDYKLGLGLPEEKIEEEARTYLAMNPKATETLENYLSSRTNSLEY